MRVNAWFQTGLLSLLLLVGASAFTQPPQRPAVAASSLASAPSASSAASATVSALSGDAQGSACAVDEQGPLCKAFKDGTCSPSLTIALCKSKLSSETGPEKAIGLIKTSGLLEALVAALGAGGVYLLTRLRMRVVQLTRRLGDPMMEKGEARDFRSYGVNVILVGEGGSGKTSLIRALSGSRNAAPSRSTALPSTYCIVHEVDVESSDPRRFGQSQRSLRRIYANDYQGQATNQLTGTGELKLLHEREAAIPATVLVIVVDLFRPPSPGEGAPPLRPTIDGRRVKEQIAAYAEGLVQILLGISTRLVRVVLFINKADLVAPFDGNTRALIIEAYKPLIAILGRRARQANFNVLVGSAATGAAVVGFEDPHRPGIETLYELLVNSMVEIADQKPGVVQRFLDG